MAKWHIRYGSWWMFQWCWAGWLSLGLHIEPRTGIRGQKHYGPYVDFHLGPSIISFGRLPQYTFPDKRGSWGSRGGL